MTIRPFYQYRIHIDFTPGHRIINIDCHFNTKIYSHRYFLLVVFAYYEEWSQMVSELREQAKEMMRGYEEKCKAKKVFFIYT